jgi:hypothetical protein
MLCHVISGQVNAFLLLHANFRCAHLPELLLTSAGAKVNLLHTSNAAAACMWFCFA